MLTPQKITSVGASTTHRREAILSPLQARRNPRAYYIGRYHGSENTASIWNMYSVIGLVLMFKARHVTYYGMAI